jgi:DNA polymerase
MTVYVDGKTKLSLDKEHLTNILGQADANTLKMPDMVYNALSVKLESSGSAVAKFKKMNDMADAEERVRGSFLYYGASTGRYTSRGLQLHNFKRDCMSVADTEFYRRAMMQGNRLKGNVLQTLGKMLRPTLIPEQGKVFVIGDWSGIESRGLPYLANSRLADKKLGAFKQFDHDPENNLDNYQIAAADAGVKDRQIGKVIELSMGFGGADGAFSAMAKNYGVRLPPSEVSRIVRNWRHHNSWAEVFWNALERAAKSAIRNPGLHCTAGRIGYRYDAQLMGGSLLCYLPGGTIITYPNTRIESDRSITAIKANWKPKADDKHWPRYTLWRGLLAENVTQGFCAALLRDLISRVENVVLHCHDEVALEVYMVEADATRDLLKIEMETPPSWAKGMPLKADPIILTRYGKP